MTLQNKVVALREFFGLTSAPLLAAIAEMNVIMELPSEGSLLGQVDKLVSKTGVVPASTTPVVLPARLKSESFSLRQSSHQRSYRRRFSYLGTRGEATWHLWGLLAHSRR